MASSKKELPPFGPFLEQDLEQIRTVYKSLPTWREEDSSIGTSDLADLFIQIGWPRSDEQLAAYKTYWGTYWNGRAPLSVMLPIMESLHDPIPFVRAALEACDANKDGFVQRGEYDVFQRVIKHCTSLLDRPDLGCPEWETSYEKFVEEVDINKDGRVSIEEAINRIQKWVAEVQKM